MIITVTQFLEFINVYKFENKYAQISDMSLNDVRALTNSDIYSYIYFLAESNYKTNSRIIKIEHLRTFFNYLFQIQHSIFAEPFKKIKSGRKLQKKLPNYLSLAEAQKIINVYSNSNDIIEIRDNAILHIFLNSGVRLSELKNLTIDDLNLENNTFSIIGKGNKERIGYINNGTKKVLEDYLKRRNELRPKTKTLFVSKYRI